MSDEAFDACIAVSGRNADLLLPLCIETMRRHTNMGRIKLHLIDKIKVGPVSQYIDKFGESGGAIVHKMPDVPPEFEGCENRETNGFEHDTSETCKWMVENSGSEDFMFILHFDIIFHGDILNHYIGRIDSATGQVGEHSSGIVGYRRSALKQCHVGFRSMSQFKVCEDWTGAKKLRALDDNRNEPQVCLLNVFDIGELLELNLKYRYWKVVAPRANEFDNLFTHSRSGSGYMGPGVDSIIRQNAISMLKAHNIKPIV